MLQRFTFLFICLIISAVSYSQLRVYGTSVSGNVGENVKVSFKVEGFQDITGFQFVIKYDQTKLSYVRLDDLTALSLTSDNFTLIESEGKIKTQWDDPSTVGADLSNGSILFSVVFNGICGSTSQVNLIKDGFFDLLFIDPNGDQVPVTIEPAAVTVTGTPCGGAPAVLQIDNSILANADEKKCFAVKASTGFTNITGLQTEIVLPTGCGTINEITNINSSIPGLTASNISISGNKVTLNWSSTGAANLPNGTSIFEICYTPGNACCDQTLPIAFQNSTFTQIGGSTSSEAIPGSIKIACGGVQPCELTGFGFIASDHTAPQGSEVAMQVTVQGFNDVIAMQFSMDWDPNCLELVDPDPIELPTNNLLPGFTTGSFFSPQNSCRVVVWADPGANGVTVPDGTVIFTIKFRVKGSSGICRVNFGNECMTSSVEILKTDNTTYPLNYCSGDITIGKAQLSIVDVAKKNASCGGVCDGAIEISVTGASNPVISWSNGAGNVTNISNLCAGDYTVTVTDGANTTSKTYTITQPQIIQITPTSITPATSGNNGAIDINVSGGSGNFSYTWSTTPVSTTQDLSAIPAGTYIVTVTDVSNGCTNTASFVVPNGAAELGVSIQASKHGQFDLSCNNTCDGTLTANIVGGSTPYIIKWSRNNETTSSILNVCKGNYSVTVTDAAGKTSTASYNIIAPQAITANFDIVFPTDDTKKDGTIKIRPEGGVTPYAFAWAGPDVTSGNTDAVLGVGVGTYTVTVTDANGCTELFSKNLTPGGKGCFESIGAITPNGDGKNDKLIITCLGSVQNKLLIFNRWGQKVYEATNYDNDWEGTDLGGATLPDGGYAWVLEIKETTGAIQVYKGSVSIIRSLK